MLKLTYYHARGCCDAIRLILAQSGTPYVEVNITGAEFILIKPKLTFSVIPMLEDGHLTLHHHNCITRYLAHRFNLSGETPEEEALCDMWNEECDNLLQNLWRADWEGEESVAMRQIKQAYFQKEIKPCLAEMNEALSHLSTPYLVGNRLTYADIVLKSALDSIERVLSPESNVLRVVFDEFLLLGLHYSHISELPKIKSFCASGKRF
ncbi:glutathione S-transferase 4-like [Schistocerca gregaria]|uniref:glutathione S-transferase 4-like n=1 Tax=Schistocerca gregaria TaxID=7010 RepID=UPI00211E7E3F|nr:glutathione S-transferase 4-like [Schistocerca gregaria]